MRDCKVSNIGARSDHLAVIVCFKIMAIKFKVKINGDAETNIEFNLRLGKNITNEHTYTDFNDAILQAAKVDITKKPTNQGWFHHSKDLPILPLLPLQRRDHVPKQRLHPTPPPPPPAPQGRISTFSAVTITPDATRTFHPSKVDIKF